MFAVNCTDTVGELPPVWEPLRRLFPSLPLWLRHINWLQDGPEDVTCLRDYAPCCREANTEEKCHRFEAVRSSKVSQSNCKSLLWRDCLPTPRTLRKVSPQQPQKMAESVRLHSKEGVVQIGSTCLHPPHQSAVGSFRPSGYPFLAHPPSGQ